MVRTMIVLTCALAFSSCAFGQTPATKQTVNKQSAAKAQKKVLAQNASTKRAATATATSKTETESMHSSTCEGVVPCGNPSCSCQAKNSIFDELAGNAAELRARSTQLPQHIPYESPMEESYFFRPYLPSDVLKQRKASGGWKNPYDNRFLQTIYKQQEVK
jgi:hypothetical protein